MGNMDFCHRESPPASGKMYTFGVINGDRATQEPQDLSQDHGVGSAKVRNISKSSITGCLA